MKKTTLLLFLCGIIAENAYSQFTANLVGYPLVTTGWNIGGFATAIDSTVELTTPSTNENGYVYSDTAVNLTSCAQFSVDFDYRIIPPAGGGGIADGIAFFYISNPPSGFISGGGLGLPGALNGLVFTLDTWDNDGDGLNPESELYGYSTPSTYSEANRTQMVPGTGVNGLLTFMDNGAWHHCKITYNAGNINVYYDYNPVAGITGFYLITIPAGYFGFSASTGAAYSTQSVKEVHITATGISPMPSVSSPVTYCQYSTPAALTAAGTGPFLWFTTDTATVISLPGAPVPVTTTLDTVTYFVRQGTSTCISPPDSIKVIIVPSPVAPVITGDTFYCTGAAFIPISATGTGTIKWYDVLVGGASTPTAPTVSTTIAGSHTFYASQTVNGCEGPRNSIHIIVRTTPPAPVLVSGGLAYCQYASFIPLTVTGTNVLWYSTPTGGTGSTAAPVFNTAVPGTYNAYPAQTDSGCTSPRGTITVQVHPQPAPPVVHPQPWCQFLTSSPVSATPSGSGDNLSWYGPGVTAGTSTAPTPGTIVAPDTIKYYVTETSSFGCVSDSSVDAAIIIKQPAPPVTSKVSYCQRGTSALLNAEVDSAANSYLKWYLNGTLLAGAPVPPTDTTTGSYTWYVTQTVNTCESDSASVAVTVIYTPVFGITATQPWVCQFDTLSLAYNGPVLVNPGYTWTLPAGASFTGGSDAHTPSVMVVFDSAVVNNYVTLTAVNDSGKCPSDTFIRINIVSQPSAQVYAQPNVCLGDTVSLALSTRADNATTYTWSIDAVALENSSAISIVQQDNNSGGPFSISWVDSGRHVIEVQSFSSEGCKSEPAFDTINVHMIPDAHFKITSANQSGCIDDTVQFTATAAANYNDSYVWAPAHSFENVNQPVAWGRIEEAKTIISLTVTDPFGCSATENMEIDPNTCCTVFMPNAFTPNGDGKNDYYRPVYYGYHQFHVFRIVNRWGQTVFESNNNGMQWDGNWNGVPQDMGTYFYYLKYDCGANTIETKGTVTLIR